VKTLNDETPCADHPVRGDVEAGFEIITCPACNVAVARVPAWQPIESAPRSNDDDSEETRLLLWIDDPHSHVRTVAFGFIRKDGEAVAYGYGGTGWRITHWQPLPAPPLALAERAENDPDHLEVTE
jgi:hypothetical protein